MTATVIIYSFTIYLISRTFKEEFLARHKAQESSKSFKNFLQNLPEGVSIVDDSTSKLQFINMKMKETFNLNSYVKAQRKIMEFDDKKQEIDEEFDMIMDKIAQDSLIQQESEEFFHKITQHFSIIRREDEDFEDRNIDLGFSEEERKYTPLSDFMTEERFLCHRNEENYRDSKVSIAFTGLPQQAGIEI